VPHLCEFYPGICLTTEEEARKNLTQGKKYLSQVKKNLSQSTVYILPRHPHKHTLQNNIKPPQYKLKQTQCKIYPNKIDHKILRNATFMMTEVVDAPHFIVNLQHCVTLTTIVNCSEKYGFQLK
jgi:hypothetical protein